MKLLNLLGVYPELASSVIFDPCNENNLVEVKESPLNIIIQKKKRKKKDTYSPENEFRESRRRFIHVG